MPTFTDPPRPRGGQILTGIIETDGFDTETRLSADGIATITSTVLQKIPVIQGEPGADGQDGIPGPPGNQGPPGATGAGVQGAPGVPGADGIDGQDGIPGVPGPAGAVGPTGATGAGIQGPPGTDGIDGAEGNPGPQGPTGPTGAAGNDGTSIIGPPGIPGADGSDGADGVPGPQGAVGPSGPTGATGPTGPTGNDGAIGPIGFPGQDGADGNDGIPGGVGPTGLQGPVGPTGATGSSIQGPPGADGQDGADGNQGPPGLAGATGPTGPTGATGNDGADGIGFLGPPGSDGLDGADGIPGPIGPQGVQGIQGITGNTGPTGATGSQGFFVPGSDGSDGYDGIPGSVGPIGPQGPIGPTGATGTSGTVGSVLNTAVVNFGTTAQTAGTFDITGLSGLVTNTPIAVSLAVTLTDPTEAEQSCVITGYALNTTTIRCYWNAIDRMQGTKTVQYITTTATGNLTLSPGQFVGLPVTNLVNGPARAITGAQGGENIRFSTELADTDSLGISVVAGGTFPVWTPGSDCTTARWTPTADLTLRSMHLDPGQEVVIYNSRTSVHTITLNHNDGTAGVVSGDRFFTSGNVNYVVNPGESVVIRGSFVRSLVIGPAKTAVLWAGGIPTIGSTQTNVTNITLNDGINTVIAGGPSPPNGGTLRWDFRKSRTNLVVWDDFDFLTGTTNNIGTGWAILNTGSGNWGLTQSIAGSANWGWASPVTTLDDDHPGVLNINTSNTTGLYVCMYKSVGPSPAGNILPSRLLAFEGIFKIASTTNNAFYFGLMSSMPSSGSPNPLDGVYFQMAAGAINGICRAAGASSATGLTFTPSTNVWYRLRAEQNVVGTWEFFANGSTIGTLSTHIPTAPIFLNVVVSSNLGSALTTGLFVDYVMYESQEMNR